MPIVNSISADHDLLTEWRRDIHMHPELGYEEHRTSDLVAQRLESWGVEVARNIAGTGLVGVIRGNGSSGRSIGLRADMDCLAMDEENDSPWKSVHPGRMHACGHDGHTTMLLGAAKYLAETRNFDGTVNVIFQPAEEGGAGGLKMVEEGLFERFPCDEVYGLHNAPMLPAGTIGVVPGPMMAAADRFSLTVQGKGGHAAMPHLSIDPVAIGAQIVMTWQTLVSRTADPIKSAVISTTMFHAGTAFNVIPDTASLDGTVRTFDPDMRDAMEAGTTRIAEAVATAMGGSADFRYERGYPPTVNHDRETGFAAAAAAATVGDAKVDETVPPVMGGEDFSYMLLERPGAYIWLGGGETGEDPGLHHPRYDFNDEVLPIGSSYFANLVEMRLAR